MGTIPHHQENLLESPTTCWAGLFILHPEHGVRWNYVGNYPAVSEAAAQESSLYVPDLYCPNPEQFPATIKQFVLLPLDRRYADSVCYPRASHRGISLLLD